MSSKKWFGLNLIFGYSQWTLATPYTPTKGKNIPFHIKMTVVLCLTIQFHPKCNLQSKSFQITSIKCAVDTKRSKSLNPSLSIFFFADKIFDVVPVRTILAYISQDTKWRQKIKMQCVANDIMHKKTATRTIINYIAWLNCLLCKVCMYVCTVWWYTYFNVHLIHGLHNAEEMETSFRKYKKASPSRTVPYRQEKERESK